MKKIGKIGNVEITVGIIIALGLVIDREEKSTGFYLILPFLTLGYTKYKKIKKNTYYGEY